MGNAIKWNNTVTERIDGLEMFVVRSVCGAFEIRFVIKSGYKQVYLNGKYCGETKTLAGAKAYAQELAKPE